MITSSEVGQSLRRIVGLIFRPTEEWDAITEETTTVGALLRFYVLPLALLTPIATMIGMTTFDRGWDPVHGYLVPTDRILAIGVTTYFAIIGSVLVLAAIFALIAPMYGAARDFRAALMVATYGAIPLLLAGATMLLPIMAVVGVVGLCHTLYLLWLGAQRLLHVPEGSCAEFIGISLVLLTAVSVLAGAGVSAIGLP
ncbi:MAG: Yip1 family protein [Casimicrobiaceae bacterium]